MSQKKGKLVMAGLAVLSIGAMAVVSGAASPAKAYASAKPITLVFANDGLGTELSSTNVAVKEFEKLHPNIHIKVIVESANSTQAYQTLVTNLSSGSATPDVISADVTYPATFAASHWILPLNKYGFNLKTFYPGMVKSGEYRGKLYAIPWFINVEGLYYRTDLVKTPPKTFAQVLADAKRVLKSHPKMIGVAFEAQKYEGAVTVFQDIAGGFGGSFLNAKGKPVLNSAADIRALTWLNSLIKSKVSPASVTGWQEGNVQQAFTSGQAVFGFNWPYLYPLAEAKGTPTKGHTGFIAPPVSGSHSPVASLGGTDLVINKHTKYPKQAVMFVKFLTSKAIQTQRAVLAGDPPSRSDSYTPALYKQAPWFKQEKTVYKYATPRPVTPLYPQISAYIQTALSSVYSGQMSPKAALDQAQSEVVKLMGQTHGG